MICIMLACQSQAELHFVQSINQTKPPKQFNVEHIFIVKKEMVIILFEKMSGFCW